MNVDARHEEVGDNQWSPANRPVRRTRASLVNRRNMENVRLAQTCRVYACRQLQDLLSYLIFFAYFTLCYFPEMFGAKRSIECEMKAGLAVALFAWILIGAQILVSLIWLAGYGLKISDVEKCAEYVKVASMLSTAANSLIILVGWSIWFYSV